MSIHEVADCIRIDLELQFFKGAPVPLPQNFRHGKYCCLSRKSMLKNIPAYLQSRKELYSSIFDELHEHGFFKNEFIQQILYGTHYFLDIYQYSHTKYYWKTFPYYLCLY